MTDTTGEGATMRAFVAQVQAAAGLSSYEEADVLTRATLRTLAQAISGGQSDDLLPALPPEIRGELANRSGQARAMDKGGFLDRVGGQIAAVDFDTTEHQVRAVTSTLRRWAPESEIGHTVSQLPPSLGAFFN